MVERVERVSLVVETLRDLSLVRLLVGLGEGEDSLFDFFIVDFFRFLVISESEE